MIPVDKVLSIILNKIKEKSSEELELLDLIGRFLYTDIKSSVNIPPFNNSAMDGFAIIREETSSASKDNPTKLEIIGEIQAGKFHKGDSLKKGFAIAIMTGAPVPEGADAVIPIEDVIVQGKTLLISSKVKKNANVRFAGEDISTDQIVLKKGDKIKSADLGLLASLNITSTLVYKKPEVAIITTGNEIVDPGEKIHFGQIRNSNAYTLYSEIKKYNAIPHYLGIAEDTKEKTQKIIEKAMQYDIIITTGGVSMGEYDFVKDVLEKMGIKILVEKVKMKPGKPMVFGHSKEKLFFGLPGNPVSTMVSFLQFVRPAILKMMGSKKIEKPTVSAILENDIKKKAERRHFVRGYFSVKDDKLVVSSTGPQGSGILRSMSLANCLIVLPEGETFFAKGDNVSIQLINHEEI